MHFLMIFFISCVHFICVEFGSRSLNMLSVIYLNVRSPVQFPQSIEEKNIFDYYQNQITFHFWLRVLEESLKFARPEDKRTPARINHLKKSYPIEQLDKIQIFSHVVLSEIYYYNPQP